MQYKYPEGCTSTEFHQDNQFSEFPIVGIPEWIARHITRHRLLWSERPLFGRWDLQNNRAVAERQYTYCAEATFRQSLFDLAALPDTPRSRFDLLSAHVALMRLRIMNDSYQSEKSAMERARALEDAMISAVNAALRDSGIHEATRKKQVSTLSEHFGSLAGSVRVALLETSHNRRSASLRIALINTVYRSVRSFEVCNVNALASYFFCCQTHLADTNPRDRNLSRNPWPTPEDHYHISTENTHPT